MNAIRVATETIQYKINETMVREVTRANEKLAHARPAVSAADAAA
jgi:hypothetical protein